MSFKVKWSYLSSYESTKLGTTGSIRQHITIDFDLKTQKRRACDKSRRHFKPKKILTKLEMTPNSTMK